MDAQDTQDKESQRLEKFLRARERARDAYLSEEEMLAEIMRQIEDIRENEEGKQQSSKDFINYAERFRRLLRELIPQLSLSSSQSVTQVHAVIYKPTQGRTAQEPDAIKRTDAELALPQEN